MNIAPAATVISIQQPHPGQILGRVDPGRRRHIGLYAYRNDFLQAYPALVKGRRPGGQS